MARFATFCGFILIGAMMYIWSTSVSAFRLHLGLTGQQGDLDFGVIALGIGAGAAAGSLLIGRFIDLYGPKRVAGATLALYALSIIPLGFASKASFALVFGVLLGFLRGATDTAINAHGVQVERFYRRSIMSAFHAFYSLGGFLFGMLGSYLAAQYTQSATVPFLICGSLLLILAIVIYPLLLDKDETPAEDQAVAVALDSTPHNRTTGRIVFVMVGFGVLLLGSMVGENAVADWGQEYLSRELGTTTSLAAMAISIFTGAQCFGRLIGDRIAEAIGAARVVFLCGAFAVLGLALSAFGGKASFAMLGFALFGLGLSCIAPLMLSSAGRKDPENAGRNIGIVNCIGYSGMLVSPAALSFIVSTFGISRLLYFPLVLLGLLTIFGPQLMRARADTHQWVPASPLEGQNAD